MLLLLAAWSLEITQVETIRVFRVSLSCVFMFCGRERKLCSLQVCPRTENKLLVTQRNEKKRKAKVKSAKVSFIHSTANEAGAIPEQKHPRQMTWLQSCILAFILPGKSLMLSTLHKNWYGKVRYIAELRREPLWGISARCKCLPDQKLHRIPGQPNSSNPFNAYLLLPHLLFLLLLFKLCPNVLRKAVREDISGFGYCLILKDLWFPCVWPSVSP